jgi:hypothetical protein
MELGGPWGLVGEERGVLLTPIGIGLARGGMVMLPIPAMFIMLLPMLCIGVKFITVVGDPDTGLPILNIFVRFIFTFMPNAGCCCCCCCC